MDRPTLEQQIAVSKMTDEECMEAFKPHGFQEKVDFWIFRHTYRIWQTIHWNWFDPRK